MGPSPPGGARVAHLRQPDLVEQADRRLETRNDPIDQAEQHRAAGAGLYARRRQQPAQERVACVASRLPSPRVTWAAANTVTASYRHNDGHDPAENGEQEAG